MPQSPSESIDVLPDDVWKQVLFRTQNTATLSAVGQVSKTLLRLSTSEDVYRVHVLRRTGPSERDAVGFEAAALSWRAVYRNLVALTHSIPTPVRELCIENARGQLVLLAVSEAQNVIFYDRGSDAIIGWPKTWFCRRRCLCRTDPAILQSAVVALRGNQVAIFEDADSLKSKPAVVIFDADTGRLHRRLELPHGLSPLSKTWTRDFVHHGPIVLPAGPQGRHLVFLTEENDLYVLNTDDGAVCYIWEKLATPFADLVRGPSLTNGRDFVVLGVVKRDSPGPGTCFIVRQITNGEVVGKLWLAQNERLVDVVGHAGGSSEELTFIACRVVLRDVLVVAVIVLKGASGLWTTRREVLSKMSGHTPVRASAELEILNHGRGLLYRPEGSLRFLGQIRVLMRREGFRGSTDADADACYEVHSLAYARAAGCAYRWARLSRDGRLLYACAFDNGVMSAFDLDAGGRCRGSFRARSSVTDALVLWDHVIVGTTDEQVNNVCGFHFGQFCRAFPECIMNGGLVKSG
jgi:hypothetical protein